MLTFQPGTLWSHVERRTGEALRCGALKPIATVSERVEQAGVNFIVRMISSLQAKQQAKPEKSHGNPFQPYDERMFVTDMSDTHVCLLNKFNVIDHHLLFVTRHFEDQELPLTQDDCGVVLTALREIDGLAFYNSGMVAGASQPHRHLQLVPLPLIPEDRLPMESLIRAALVSDDEGRVLPFRCALTRVPRSWLEDIGTGAAAMRKRYAELLERTNLVACDATDAAKPAPYNLLVTRQWMLLVPRPRECWEDVSVNALGFAGSLFVRERRQMEAIRAHGPMDVLRSVADSP